MAEIPRIPLPAYASEVLDKRRDPIVKLLQNAFSEVRIRGLSTGDSDVNAVNHGLSIMTDLVSTGLIATMEHLIRNAQGMPVERAISLVLQDFTTRTHRKIENIRANIAAQKGD